MQQPVVRHHRITCFGSFLDIQTDYSITGISRRLDYIRRVPDSIFVGILLFKDEFIVYHSP